MNVCYTCFEYSQGEMTPLKTMDADMVSFTKKLTTLIPTELIKHGKMEICTKCKSHLQVAFKFIDTVQQSQKLLRKYVQKRSLNSGSKSSVSSEGKDIKNDGSNFTSEDFFNDNDDWGNSDNSSDVSEDNQDRFSCDKCLRDFSTLEEAEDHECCSKELKPDPVTPPFLPTVKKRIKIEPQNTTCNICNKTFKRPQILKRHMITHIRTSDGVSCPICNKKFMRATSIKRHLETHKAPPGQKSKKTPFVCTICGKTFPYSNSRQRHMRMHMGIKHLECSICHHKFSQGSHLRVHMRSHTGEKPFVCEICGIAYSFNASLQKHIAQHKNVGQYETYY